MRYITNDEPNSNPEWARTAIQLIRDREDAERHCFYPFIITPLLFCCSLTHSFLQYWTRMIPRSRQAFLKKGGGFV
jgi:hypothetical protein